MADLNGKFDLKKRMHKAQRKGLFNFSEALGSNGKSYKFGVETLKKGDENDSFSGAAHVR
jgi:hypothetical protein